jgi:hypothetical protein
VSVPAERPVAARGLAHADRLHRELIGSPGDAELTERLLAPVLGRSSAWWLLLLLAGGGAGSLAALSLYSTLIGPGVWGNNIPVAWGNPIISFVWWGGIGHATALFAALLVLLGRPWGRSIQRAAETVALAAFVTAGLFPLLHMGRLWFFYWLVPYPSTTGMWPQFRSSLPADVAIITATLVVTSLFWYVGLLPDLAALRDRAAGGVRRRVYGVFALGWRGAGREWREQQQARTLLAAITALLSLTALTVMSLDLAITLLPGWHTTLLPVHMIAGGLAAGIALLLVVLLPIRRILRIQDLVTDRHLDNLARLLLVASLTTLYVHGVETFTGWYSALEFERFTYVEERTIGPYALHFWGAIAGVVLLPQILWLRSMRVRPVVLFGIALGVLGGMWLERLVLVVSSQARTFLPSAWRVYGMTWVDFGMLLGAGGFFLFVFLILYRVAPLVSPGELKRLRRELEGEAAVEPGRRAW